MKNRNKELPWASCKSRHNTNARPKSPGLPAGAKHGYLLTVNMNFFLHFRLEQTAVLPAL